LAGRVTGIRVQGSGFGENRLQANIPHSGKQFSTVWKKRPIFSTQWKKFSAFFHTMEKIFGGYS
jgi:hypothetical protein